VKKISIISTLVFASLNLLPQEYLPLVDTTKIWCTGDIYLVQFGRPPFSYFIKFSQQIVINELNYNTVIRADDEFHNNWYNYGYIREDSTKKVFYKQNMESNDRLIYDFNIQVSDTVFIPFEDEYPLIVANIDTIFFAEKIRKRYYMQRSIEGNPAGSEIWIEGIGCLRGIFESGFAGMVGANTITLCYYENDTLRYIDEYYTDCYLGTMNIKELDFEKPSIKIAPNPINNNGKISFTNIKSQFLEIKIYNSIGRLVFNKLITDDTEITINKRNFNSGIFVICIYNKNRLVIANRMIIQ